MDFNPADPENSYRQESRSSRDQLLSDLGLPTEGEQKAYVNIGSPAFSNVFIEEAVKVFAGLDGRIDVDGYLFQALTWDSETWETRKQAQLRTGKDEMRQLDALCLSQKQKTFHQLAQDLRRNINKIRGRPLTAPLNIQVVDFGEDFYWGDTHQLRQARQTLSQVNNRANEEGEFARELAGIDGIQPDKYNNIVVGNSLVPQDGSVQNCVIINTRIYGSAPGKPRINGAVLVDSDIGIAGSKIEKGAVAYGCTVENLILGRNAYARSSIGELIKVADETAHVSVPTDRGDIAAGLEEWRADMTVEDLGSPAYYQQKLPENPGSFQDKYAQVRQSPVPQETVDREVEKLFRKPIRDKLRALNPDFNADAQETPLGLAGFSLSWLGHKAGDEVTPGMAVKARWLEELVFSGPLLIIAALSWIFAIFGFSEAAEVARYGLIAAYAASSLLFGFSHDRMYVWENGKIVDKGPMPTGYKWMLVGLGAFFRMGFLLEFLVPGLGAAVGFLLANFLHDLWNTWIARRTGLPLGMRPSSDDEDEALAQRILGDPAKLTDADVRILQAIAQLESEAVSPITQALIAQRAGIAEMTVSLRKQANRQVGDAVERAAGAAGAVLSAIAALQKEGVARITQKLIATRSGVAENTISTLKKTNPKVEAALQQLGQPARASAPTNDEILEVIAQLESEGVFPIKLETIAQRAGTTVVTLSRRRKQNTQLNTALEQATLTTASDIAILNAITILTAERPGVPLEQEEIIQRSGVSSSNFFKRKSDNPKVAAAIEKATGKTPLALSSRVLEWMGIDAAARGEVSADVAVKARWMEELIFSGPLLVIAAASWVSAVFGFPDAALAFQGLLALTYLLWSGFAFGFSHERMYVWENGKIIDKGPLSTAQKIKLSFLGLGFRIGFLLEFFAPGLGLLVGFLLANFLHDFWNTYLAKWLGMPLGMAKKKQATEESAEEPLPDLPQTLSIDELSKRFALLMLVMTRGNVSLAAERMGVQRSTLYRRLSSYGITSETRSMSNEDRAQIAREALGLGIPSERENFRFIGDGGTEIENGLDERLERLIIERALIMAEGNASKAADLLQVSRATLSRRMRDFGKSANDFKGILSINREWLFHAVLSQKGNIGKSAEHLGISWMEAFVLLAMNGIIGLTPAQRVAQIRKQQLTRVLAQARDGKAIVELRRKTDDELKEAAVQLRSRLKGHDIHSPEDLGRAVALLSSSSVFLRSSTIAFPSRAWARTRVSCCFRIWATLWAGVSPMMPFIANRTKASIQLMPKCSADLPMFPFWESTAWNSHSRLMERIPLKSFALFPKSLMRRLKVARETCRRSAAFEAFPSAMIRARSMMSRSSRSSSPFSISVPPSPMNLKFSRSDGIPSPKASRAI
jgi:DNA-binding protein Fis